MNVLSLFDGLSCGRLALNNINIPIDKYYSSEVDLNSIKVSSSNFPMDNQYRLGDVRKINVNKLDKIDLLIGGSPCTSFSFSGKKNGMTTKDNIKILSLEEYLYYKKNNYEFEGQSYLFWEYIRILEKLKKKNKNIKFLLENVVMNKDWENIISKTLGIEPILINSSLVSAQFRPRLYWTNIKFDNNLIDENILIKNILDIDNDYPIKELICSSISFDLSSNNIKNIKKNSTGKSYFFEQQIYDINHKTRTLKAGGGSGNIPKIITSIKNNKIFYRYLSPLECERLQNIPDNYTNFVPKSHRYKMIGNGWTINVISHILKGLII